MKILNRASRFDFVAICLVSIFLLLYFNYGRGFLSWRNFVILVVGSICIFLVTLRTNSSLIQTTFTLALIPIIPDPLGGIPICCLVLLLCFALYGPTPQAKRISFSETLINLNLIILMCALLFAAILGQSSGDSVFLTAWLYGILIIFMAIRTIPNLTTSKELIHSYWVGSSITCTLGLILYQFPSVKIPGISVSVNYVYQAGAQLYGRYSGVLGDYELYGQFCGFSATICLYVGLTSSNNWKKAAGYLTFMVSLQQLFLTGTRSSLFIGVLACVVVFIRISKSPLRNRLGLTLILTAFLAFITYFRAAINESGSIFRIGESINNFPAAFASDRGDLWQFFLNQIGNELIKIPNYLQFPVSAYGTLPHSLPITLIFMFGLIPFISFLIVVLFPLVILSWRGSLNEFLLKLMLTQLLLESLKVEATRLPQYLTVFFTLIAICYVCTVEKIRFQEYSEKSMDPS